MSTLADFRLPPAVRQTLEALCPVICGDDPPRSVLAAVIDEAELYIRALPPEARWGLVLGSISFDLLAVLSEGQRFCRLRRDRAEAYFSRWWDSRIPLMSGYTRGIKAAIAIAYFEHPYVKARLDYHPGRWVEQVKRQRLEHWTDDIRAHEQRLRARTEPDAARDAESDRKREQEPPRR